MRPLRVGSTDAPPPSTIGPIGTVGVISGHTHDPSVESKSGVLFLNPGSAGPRRFRLPVSVASLDIRQGAPDARIIHLSVPEKP